MKMKFYLILILQILVLNLFSSEEKNLNSFFKLNEKQNKLKLNLKEIQICKVKTKDYIDLNEYDVQECYFLDKNLSSKLKQIIEEHKKKKEIQLVFLKDQKQKIKPILESKELIYQVHSILYSKKTKTFHIELLKGKEEYYYFLFDPEQIQIEETE